MCRPRLQGLPAMTDVRCNSVAVSRRRPSPIGCDLRGRRPSLIGCRQWQAVVADAALLYMHNQYTCAILRRITVAKIRLQNNKQIMFRFADIADFGGN